MKNDKVIGPKVKKIETYEVHFPIEGCADNEVDVVECNSKLEAEVVALFDDEDDCISNCDRNDGSDLWHIEMARLGNWIVRHKDELLKVLSKK